MIRNIRVDVWGRKVFVMPAFCHPHPYSDPMRLLSYLPVRRSSSGGRGGLGKIYLVLSTKVSPREKHLHLSVFIYRAHAPTLGSSAVERVEIAHAAHQLRAHLNHIRLCITNKRRRGENATEKMMAEAQKQTLVQTMPGWTKPLDGLGGVWFFVPK